jgi:hypothetical protein
MRDFVAHTPLVTKILPKPFFIEYNRQKTVTIKFEDFCIALMKSSNTDLEFFRQIQLCWKMQPSKREIQLISMPIYSDNNARNENMTVDTNLSYSEQNYLVLNARMCIKGKYPDMGFSKTTMNIVQDRNSNRRPLSGNLLYQNRNNHGNPCTISSWTKPQIFSETLQERSLKNEGVSNTLRKLRDSNDKKCWKVDLAYTEARKQEAISKHYQAKRNVENPTGLRNKNWIKIANGKLGVDKTDQEVKTLIRKHLIVMQKSKAGNLLEYDDENSDKTSNGRDKKDKSGHILRGPDIPECDFEDDLNGP